MIKSAQNCPVSQLFQTDGKWVYKIPKYQREYTWGKDQWEVLFDDLLENDPGYYLGSVICINDTPSTFDIQHLELVDGQQRLITISLLLAAIYHELVKIASGNIELDEDQRAEPTYVKQQLVLKRTEEQVRLIPQIQNQNDVDFFATLGESGVIQEREVPKYAGNRKILRAYRYFTRRIKDVASTDTTKSTLNSIGDLLEKVNRSCMVKIEVDSHADAYTLFESLNNRGIPLNAVDLIKNKLLASTESTDASEIDSYFTQWVQLLKYIGEDYAIQERFFRHYYNAFKNTLLQTAQVQIATKSSLIRIYEKLINSDSKGHLKSLVDAAKIYAYIISNGPDDDFSSMKRLILDLEHVQGTPSHVLLLYLMSERLKLGLSDPHLTSIFCCLIQFFVRRNLTDTPATRDLTRIFMNIIDDVESHSADSLTSIIEDRLRRVSVSDSEFEQKLRGPVYLDNAGVTRFILCTLAEKAMTRETKVDLWERRNNQFVWTIEHVLPQGQPLPNSWIDMVGGGNEEEAKEIQSSVTHNLGNLTISGFNSALGNKSFQEKRDRVDSKGRPEGYRNGLVLNSDLAKAETWSKDQIDKRTDVIVAEVMSMYGYGSLKNP